MVERKAIIVRSGVPIECIENVEVEARVLKEDGPTDVFEQGIGGWILMHPDHWESLKKEIERLRSKVGD